MSRVVGFLMDLPFGAENGFLVLNGGFTLKQAYRNVVHSPDIPIDKIQVDGDVEPCGSSFWERKDRPSVSAPNFCLYLKRVSKVDRDRLATVTFSMENFLL